MNIYITKNSDNQTPDIMLNYFNNDINTLTYGIF